MALLVWMRATGIWFFLASWVTLITILWETVLMKRISRSGLPSFRFREPFSLVNTLALQPCSLQMHSYWAAIRSFPPTMTTLMAFSFAISVKILLASPLSARHPRGMPRDGLGADRSFL